MNVKIEIIHHSKQRYPTVGDWRFDPDGNLIISVSQLSNWRREMLVAVHELCEALMCRNFGISQDQVDAFDKEFEKSRPEGDASEPGDDPAAPYCGPHCTATGIERILSRELGVSWRDYENEINSLP